MIPINKKGVYYLTQIQQSSVAMHHPEVVAAGAAQSHRPAQRHGCSSQDVSRRRPAGRSQGKKRVLQRHGSQHRKTYASTSSPRSQVYAYRSPGSGGGAVEERVFVRWGVRVVVVVEEVCFGVGGEMLLSQQIFRTRAESQRVAWQACSPAYNTLSHIQVVCKGFISANILKGDVSDVGPEAIAIRVTSAEVIIVAFQHGF